MQQPYIVGITGGSGSGKTYVLNRIMEAFDESQICLVSQDNYYKPRQEQHKDEKGIYNFDLPQAIDEQQYSQDILSLKSGREVRREEYTFNNPHKVPRIFTFSPRALILVEGLFVLHFKSVAQVLDLRVFVDAKNHIRLKRRILRDNLERGYDLADVLYRYENHVMPCYEKYIEPYKNEVDMLIPNHHKSDTAIEILIHFLKSKL